MHRLHILVEGQTEEVVVDQVVKPYLSELDVSVEFSIFKTKQPAGGPAYKGGLSSWPKILGELRLLLRDRSISLLTTMFDYYAFPADSPGMTTRPKGSPYNRVRHVEDAIATAVNDKRFLPHLVLHELEAWVLADCPRLGQLMGDRDGSALLARVVAEKSGPELVDEGPQTAPSKRILSVYPGYRKTIDGPVVIADAGLESVRRACPHADDWFTAIETRLLAEPSDATRPT